MEELKNRVRAFISHLNISEREFCMSIGASAAFVQNIGKSIKRQKIEAIMEAYPCLNMEWLLSGRGEMLLSAGDKPWSPFGEAGKPKAGLTGEESELVSRLLALVEAQQKTIAEQSATISRQAFALGNLAASVAPGAPSAD